ncbi:hypothetical protein [Cloacibacterium sp.]|uniref:hypothetical protein n=1 Tax=Cloacibacterium sp. TaxID=1913682 RepID=UPI0039E70BC9
MIKNYPLQFTLTLILFLIMNTSYFWEGEFGIFTIPIFIILFILFFLLLLELIRQIYISIRDKFTEKRRNYLLTFMFIILTLIFIKPRGIINFEKLEGENVYFAQAEGVANCTSTLKLKKTNKFIYESICFGMEKTKGNYIIKNDSIYFKNFNKNKFQFNFGIINGNSIKLYRYKNDKNPFIIPIIKKY